MRSRRVLCNVLTNVTSPCLFQQPLSVKNDNSVTNVSEEDSPCFSSITAVEETAGALQSGFQQTDINPNSASQAGGYNQCSPQNVLNQMPPPSMQPTFSQRPLFANARPQYSYPGGFPQYQSPQTYYPSPYQCPTQGLSIPRTALPFGPSLDAVSYFLLTFNFCITIVLFTWAPNSLLMIEYDRFQSIYDE